MWTDESLVDYVTNLASVRSANPVTYMNADGMMAQRPATPTELERTAYAVLESVVVSLLLDQSVVRFIGDQEYTLTLTGSATYELPSKIGRIISIRSSEGRPVTILATPTAYDEYKYANFSDSEADDDDDGPSVVYQIGRSENGNLKIGLLPYGATSTLDIRYVPRINPPVSISNLPYECYPVVELEVVKRMGGGVDGETVRTTWQDMRRALGRPARARSVQNYPPEVSWGVNYINSSHSRRSSGCGSRRFS